MANKIYGSNNEPLKVQVITDVHYYSRKLGVEGKAYDKMESKSQMVIKDSPYVIKSKQRKAFPRNLGRSRSS